MKTLTTLSVLTLAALLSACGSTIQGVVRDKPSGNPIPSAHVTIEDESTTTNALGVYRIDVSAKPSSTLSVNAPGYFMYSESLGEQLIHDIELVPR